jgi:dUTP pyrophosphatase
VRCTETIVLNPGERILAKTGLFVEIPLGYELQVRPRSGLALKHGITVLNTPGTIDADYRGEIGVILMNHGLTVVEFKPADRIAQLVLNKVERIQWLQTESLTGTKRGQGGFGSTGN